MRLVRFLKRAYHADTLIEPGNEVLLADDVVLGSHMIDVGNESDAPARTLTLVSSNDPDEWERRAKATEEAMQRAEATRQAELASTTEG